MGELRKVKKADAVDDALSNLSSEERRHYHTLTYFCCGVILVIVGAAIAMEFSGNDTVRQDGAKLLFSITGALCGFITGTRIKRR